MTPIKILEHMPRWLPALIALVCLGVGTVYAQDEVAVSVSLDRDTIGMDEHAVLEIVVSGTSQNLPKPQLPTLPMFEVYSQGHSSNITIVNGKVESSVTYRHLILPQKPGTYPITDIAVVYHNKRYRGQAVSLTVLSEGTSAPKQLEDQARDRGGKSKDCFLEAEVDNTNPYVNEQVTLTLKFYTAVQYYGSPELAEPTTTGFWTEILGNKAPYYQKISGRTYKVIERKYALFPTQTGKLTVSRAAITATVATQKRRRDMFDVFGMLGRGEEVTVRSQPIVVDVKPLPEKGRPADFTGTIGKFSISATANKSEVEVNQPVSVLINIKGVGNIKSVAEPVIPDLPDFRIYKASSSENVSKLDNKIGGTKTFEEVFIPKRPGNLEIPSLSFNYFDPRKGRYKVIRTRPIQLKVRKPEGYAATPNVPFAGPDITIGAESRDIRFIKDNPGPLQRAGQLLITSPMYIVVNTLPLAFLLATVVVRKRREKLTGDISYARARGAAKHARKRLTQARKLADTTTAGEFYAECSLAVISYIADKLNISPHGLTSDRIVQLLSEHAADRQIIDDTVAFLNQCGFARYAPTATTQTEIDRTLKAAENLMVQMGGVRF